LLEILLLIPLTGRVDYQVTLATGEISVPAGT
jgi:hypothetical protein